jgi:hypothetical protein
MDMILVDSDAVSAVGYSAGTLALTWRSSGKTSLHPGVPVAVYDGLMAAESKGKFIAAHIRKQYPAAKSA